MRRCWLIVLLGCVPMASSFSGADPIPPAYRAIATEADVPPAILFVVALQESGTKLTSGRVLPWPWTLNIAGEPQRFRTRSEAYYALCSAIQSKQQVDVGLGQINWNYNASHLLNDRWLAFDPYFNLRVASRLLRTHFDAGGRRDWWAAVGDYHSPGRKPAQRNRAERYAARAKARYQRLVAIGATPFPMTMSAATNQW